MSEPQSPQQAARVEVAKASIDHVNWWEKRTAWTAIGGIVSALVILVSLFTVQDPATLVKIAAAAGSIGMGLNSLGTVFARSGGVDAAANALEQAQTADARRDL